jgi:nucleotide-binding universal stress UspA family protein
MYRTIVVGCDGSAHESEAIALAQQLRDPQGKLILVNAFSPSWGITAPGVELYSSWLADQSADVLKRAEANVAYGVPCELRPTPGRSPAAALNDVAEATGADLIVVGGSHHRLASDSPVRRTARHLLHGAPCAVAVAVPGQSARFGGSPRICVAYDNSPEARVALDAAYDVAVATAARVDAYFALEPFVFASGFAVGPAVGFEEGREDEAHAELDAAVARAPEGVAVEGHVLLGSAAQRIADAAADSDLLVTGSRGFGALHRVIVGSTSSGLLRDGRTPVLVTPRVLVADVTEPAAGLLPVGVAR